MRKPVVVETYPLAAPAAGFVKSPAEKNGCSSAAINAPRTASVTAISRWWSRCAPSVGPRQRVVAQLGELSEDQQHRWEQTAVFHTVNRDAGQLRLFEDCSIPDEADSVRVRLGKVGWTHARSFGGCVAWACTCGGC